MKPIVSLGFLVSQSSCICVRIEYLFSVLFTVYKCSMYMWNKEMKLALGSLVDAMSKHSSSGGGIRGMVMEGSCAHVLCTEGLQMGRYLCVCVCERYFA